MINMKLKAVADEHSSAIYLETSNGDGRVKFDNLALFYIVTGFKTVEAYNEHQDAQPTKFLMWDRKH